jgi:hypothetical protein
MDFERPQPIGIIKRSGIDSFDNIQLPDSDVSKVTIYSTTINQEIEKKGVVRTKKRIYHIELYHYTGFGIIKFYPKCKKGDVNKFKIRGPQIGYTLSVPQIRSILRFCSIVMKAYLDDHPNNFIGYIGQTDDKDNSIKKMRLEAQRAFIYDRYVTSVFKVPKYNVSSKELFGAFNLKLIRTVKKHRELTLTANQKTNYEHFKNYLFKKQSIIPELMTERARRIHYPQLFE